MRLALNTLLETPDNERYGYELAESAGLAPGTIYPILLRLEDAGWVQGRWEDIDPSAQKRPPRRYFRLTPAGRTSAEAALARRPGRQDGEILTSRSGARYE